LPSVEIPTVVCVVDKDWDAGNYYFLVVAFAEMFILKSSKSCRPSPAMFQVELLIPLPENITAPGLAERV
jgi:hypothetical protein